MAKLIKKTADGLEFDTNQAISAPNTAYDFKINGTIVASIDENGISGGGAFAVVFPTGLAAPADKNNIEATAAAVDAAGGGIVHLTKGTYDLTGATNGLNIIGNNLIIQGEGIGTILQANGDTALQIQGVGGSVNQVLNNYVAGDTSIFTTTAGDAANFPVGGILIIDGTENVTGDDQSEYNVVVSNNPGTGEVVLKYPCKFNLNSPTADVIVTTDGQNIQIRDLKIERLGGDQYGVLFQSTDYGRIDNIYIEDFTGSPGVPSAISANSSANFSVMNCRVENWAGSDAVLLAACINNRVENNDLLNCNDTVVSNHAGVRSTFSTFNTWIVSNRIYNQGGPAIWVDGPTAKTFILHNDILRAHGSDTILIEGENCIIENNTIQNCELRGINIVGNNSRQVIRGNRIINQGTIGIQVGTGSEEYIIADNIINTANSGISANGAKASITGNTLRNLNTAGIEGTLNNSTIDGNTVFNFALTGAGIGISCGTGDDNIIVNNRIDTSTTGGSRAIRLTSNRNRILNNIITNMSSVAIDTDGLGRTQNIIQGNHIDNCLGGIDAFADDNQNQILDNVFTNITGNAIDCFGAVSAPITQWIIRGNVFETISADAIAIRAAQNFIITENIAIDSITGDALQVTDFTVISDRNIVKNNNFTGNTINDTSTGANSITADNLL